MMGAHISVEKKKKIVRKRKCNLPVPFVNMDEFDARKKGKKNNDGVMIAETNSDHEFEEQGSHVVPARECARTCHCREKGDDTCILCIKCHEFFHLRCVKVSKDINIDVKNYICHHCIPGGRSIGFYVENLDPRGLAAEVTDRYLGHVGKTKAQLQASLTYMCGDINIPKTTTRDKLSRMVVYAEIGIDVQERVDSMSDPLDLWGLKPPPEGSVARLLYSRLEDLARIYPGLGMNPLPKSKEKYGLTPHALRHLDHSFQYHVLRNANLVNFKEFLVGGVDHWNNIHRKPQCMRMDNCRNTFQIPGDPKYKGASEQLRKILNDVADLYPDDGLAIDPFLTS